LAKVKTEPERHFYQLSILYQNVTAKMVKDAYLSRSVARKTDGSVQFAQ